MSRSRPLALLFVALWGGACAELFTELPEVGGDLESPLGGLTREQLALFVQGDAAFERAFTVAEGLGPIFNERSCAACHPGDGRGTPREALIRFSRGADPVLAEGGPQLQTRAIPGVLPEVLPDGVDVSVRLPPPVFGMGLIESIPVEAILALADPDDADGDGISGRPNWVEAAPYASDAYPGGGSGLQLGRYGRKASVSTLLEQVATAYHQDMGLTSDFLPEEIGHPQSGFPTLGDTVPDPEVSAAEVHLAVAYVRLLAPPARGPLTAPVLRGEVVFESLGCAACHVPSLTTGPSPIAPLDRVAVPLYSDLLLHDLGPGLADGRPDGDANGSEWRTAPLWGLRLVPEFLGGREFYLHDGRALTLDEAILWHGGEAQAARDRYEALSVGDRADLLAFLRSL
jgi:CxxC motif-containing protein (DUF1111 family)